LVSGVGDDVNPCSRTASCTISARAIYKTARESELNCLDPGGFGAFPITRLITITFGLILAALTNGIDSCQWVEALWSPGGHQKISFPK
jgi:hypothetical protein